jgi:hypothetical protein
VIIEMIVKTEDIENFFSPKATDKEKIFGDSPMKQ